MIRWTDTDYKLLEEFQILLSANSPSGDATFANCTSADLERGNSSCTSYRYSPMLENIVSEILIAIRGNSTGNSLVSEESVSFELGNSSFSQPGAVLIPNRQVMRSLSSLVSQRDIHLEVKPQLVCACRLPTQVNFAKICCT